MLTTEFGYDRRSTQVGCHREVRQTCRKEDYECQLVEQSLATRSLYIECDQLTIHETYSKKTHHKRQECHHEGGQEDDGEGCPKPVGCVCDDVFHGIRRVNVDGIIAASSQYWNNHGVEV